MVELKMKAYCVTPIVSQNKHSLYQNHLTISFASVCFLLIRVSIQINSTYILFKINK